MRLRPGIAGYASVLLVAAVYLSGVGIVSDALLLLIAGLALVAVGVRARLDNVAVPAVVYVVVVLLIGAAVHSLPTSAGELPSWLNNDGRFVVALLPAFVIGLSDVTVDDVALFVRALAVAVWCNLPILATSLVSGSPFHGLTSTHHAIGMATAASLVIFVAARRHSKLLGFQPGILTCGLAAVMCAASGSRTALVGLLAVLAWTAWRRRSVANVARTVLATAVVVVFAALISDRVASSLGLAFDPAFRDLAASVFFLGTDQSEVSQYYATINAHGHGGAEVGNVLARLYYWGVALGMWLKSPLLGIGSFRFNDGSLTYAGWDGVAAFATGGVRDSTGVIGAHNQYVGALVENGIVGLALLLAIWIYPYRVVLANSRAPQALRQSALAMVPFAFATAITGYTLTSPGLTFVCLTWLVMLSVLRVDDESQEDAEAEVGDDGRRALLRRLGGSRRLSTELSTTSTASRSSA